ncbi:transporter substrate-binding domain-containing protein [Leucobacter soli]|uniref:Amino-acid-binding protein YxeM n=1 Tax=Leucobacter soli TaxID=2812850 RepID=A0A916NWP9_9MICO|nr:transporter substrate-binding domain-containing protein [Leucobacter soli]CAG7618665.1 putative amino-acid-binding protein YxeM [Leucobacter soli]
MTRLTRTTAALGALTIAALGLSACASGGGAEAAESAGAETLVVGTSGAVKPYTFYDEDDNLTGYDIEVLKLIDEKLDDVAFEFQATDFPGLFPALDAGRFNIVANNLSTTEERREKYDFSDPYIEAVFGIVQQTGKGVAGLTTIDQLAGKRTYGTPGLNYTKMLEAYNEANPDAQIEIEYTELELQQQFQGLATGAVDFIFSEQVVFTGYGADAGLDVDFTQLDSDYLVDTYGTNLYSAFAFSRATDQSAVIEEINGALGELIADGTLAELSAEFFGGIDVTPRS